MSNLSQVPLIARAMKKNRLVASILLLQVIIATACVTNITFLLAQRLATLTYDTGLQERGLGVIESEFVGVATGNPAAAVKADLEVLRRVPGVTGVIAAESLPLGQHNWTVGFTNRPVQGQDITGVVEAEPTVYSMSAGAIGVLGIRLVAGRDFSPGAYVQMQATQNYAGLYQAGEVILSKALAKHLFADANALGRAIYADGTHPLRVVGVVETLSRPLLRTDGDNDMSLLLPLLPDGNRVMYAVRSKPAVLADVLERAKAALAAREPNRMVLRLETFGELRSDYFRHDRTMAILFLSADISLMIVTATGVCGLASFWVRRRYPQIGIRRALGARKSDVLSYFLIENLMLTGAGAVIGSVLAVVLNVAISHYYEVPRIDPLFLAIGVLLVFALGQLAAWIPARRAAQEAPVAVLNST